MITEALKAKLRQARVNAPEENECCPYAIDGQDVHRKLVLDCRQCGEKGDLCDPVCMSRVVDILSSEFSVDRILFSHHIEKDYGPDVVNILKGFVDVRGETQRMARRSPHKEYCMRTDEKLWEKKCAGCRYNPQKIFGELDTLLIEDIPGFFKKLENITSIGPREEKTEGCQFCKGITSEDALYLNDMASELGKLIIYEGFRIVL